MKVEKHIRCWIDNGVSDSETAARILEHESARYRWLTIKNLIMGLAGLSLFLAITEIIRVNWEQIPGIVKIGAHIILNGVIAALLFKFFLSGKNKTVWFKLLVGLLAFLTLTLVALIGQIFEVRDPAWKALIFWLFLTTPFWLWLAEDSQKLIRLWIMSFLVTYASFAYHYTENYLTPALATTLLFVLLPYGMIAIGQLMPFRKLREATCKQISKTGFILLVFAVSSLQLFWYEPPQYIPHGEPDHIMESAALANYSAVIGIIALRRIGILVPVPTALDLLLVVSSIVGSLPYLFSHQDYPVIHGAIIMGYVGFCGWVGLKSGYPKFLRVAAIFIALISIYIELLGFFHKTGFSLILGGLALIALFGGTRKILASSNAFHDEKLS